MRKIVLSLLAAASLATPLAAEPASKLVTVVTAEAPQTQLMSMVLTMQAIQKGTDTRILLCGPAGDIALKDAPEAATAGQPPKGMSPQGLLKAAMSKGATVEVCAIYLPGKGATPDALLDGVTVAQPPNMTDTLLDTDTQVWSF